MIYLKKIIRKMNKYIKNKNERKYKKLEVNILKNYTLNSISKNTKRYWEATKKIIYKKIKWTFQLLKKLEAN